MTADRRRLAARPDLAAAHLEGTVPAARYASGRVMEVAVHAAPLRPRPDPDASIDTEALLGERITVYDEEEGWAWGQLEADRYVGYLPAEALRPPGPAPTHRVVVPRTHLYPAPDMKRPPLGGASLGSLVAVTEHRGSYARTPHGFVYAAHLAPAEAIAPDVVAVAESLLGVPYLWGGKTSLGIDCSGLVQISAAAAGLALPRDSDMQAAEVGTVLADPQQCRRGDLVFWKGHVALLCDAQTIVHANAFHMQVVREPLAGAIARIEAAGSGAPTLWRRPGPPA